MRVLQVKIQTDISTTRARSSLIGRSLGVRLLISNFKDLCIALQSDTISPPTDTPYCASGTASSPCSRACHAICKKIIFNYPCICLYSLAYPCMPFSRRQRRRPPPTDGRTQRIRPERAGHFPRPFAVSPTRRFPGSSVHYAITHNHPPLCAFPL